MPAEDVDMDDSMDPVIEEVREEGQPMAIEVSEAVHEKDKAEEDAEMSGSYTWVLEGWPRPTKTKIHSEKFEIGTYIWRLLVIPGNDNQGEFLSVFLDSPEAPYTPAHLSPRAKFTLALESTLGREHDHKKDSEHLFTSQQMDWGFNQFVPLVDVADPAKGLIHEGGVLRIRVEVQVRRDERLSWDSRKETGYVGLKNQGATCYMNSLLQCLYYLPFFRKAVYHMPTSESDDPSKSMPLALQSVFYKLQYSRTPPSTKDLTKSFGWNTYDAFFQHDVQELNRVLCEKLDDKMKGTAVEKSINYLFEGHTESYVECTNVDVRSTKRESFMDIQLVVRGCRDVYDSFDKYCEVELLQGDNRYRTDSHGLQDACKGLKFEALPPVLQLHLRRFDYDYQRDTMLKLNDRYEFPEELDLDRDNYLARNADRSVRNLYRLHSVLVHSGGVHGGHYYAFIRPDGHTWYRFDDERVTKEDARAAIEEQYGGDDDAPPLGGGGLHGPFNQAGGGNAIGGGGGFKLSKLSNAYMLVYVRVSQWDDVMCRVTKDDIPMYLRERLEVEQREKEARQKAKAEAHLYCSVRLARDADMAEQVGKRGVYFDLVDYDKLPEASTLRVRKHTKFGDLKKLVAERLGVPVEKQRYWTWTKRQNNTTRLADFQLGPEHEEQSLTDLREHADMPAVASKHSLLDLRLYLETPWPDADKPLHKPARNEMLLFFKHYDPETEQLRYVGHLFAPKAARMRDLFPMLRAMAGLPPDAPLQCYEEIKWEPSIMVDAISAAALLYSNAQLETGDIIAFQVAQQGDGDGSEAEGEGGASRYRFPIVKDFLSWVCNRMLVKFKRLDAWSQEGEGFTLELLKGMGYDDVTAELARHLGLASPDLLRLTQQNGFSQQPMRSAVRYRAVSDLARLLSHSNHPTDTLYYEVLDLPLPQLEALKTLKVNFHDERTALVGEPHTIRVARDAVVGDVLEELRKRLPPEHAGKRLRLLELLHSKIFKVCDMTEEVGGVNAEYWTLRAEPVPQDELEQEQEQEQEGQADAGGGGGGGGGGVGEGGPLLIHVYHVAPDRQEQQHSTAGSGGGGAISGAGGGKGGSKQQLQQQQQPHQPQQQQLQQQDTEQQAPQQQREEPAGQQQQAVVPVLPFGEPFLLRIGRAETLDSIKTRIRTRLGVEAAAFAKWRFCFVPGGNRSLPEYLADGDVPAERFATPTAGHALGADLPFLGCEHEDKGSKRPTGHRAAYGFERPVKINS